MTDPSSDPVLIFGGVGGLGEADVFALMRASLKRSSLKRSSFNRWRARVYGRRTKHAKRCDPSCLRHRANHRWQGG